MRLDLTKQLRLYLGLYELELDRHWKHLLLPGASAFDVGAQFGYDALAIASRTHSRVAAFESERSCMAQMDANLALNPKLASLIQPVKATVGLGSEKLGLDQWVNSGGFVPDLIKIDIEGAEVEALHSAQRILEVRRPALIVEVHSERLERQAGQLLVSHGYRPIVVSQRKVLPDHRPTVHNRWLVAA